MSIRRHSAKRLAIIVGLLVAVLAITFRATGHFGQRIHSWKSHSLGSLLNVHQSAQQHLRVDGTEYTPVSGFAPYYLKIPELDAIFFAQTSGRESYFDHCFYFMRERRYIAIHGDSLLWFNINAPVNPDRVVLATPERIVLAVQLDGWIYYDFDLRTKTMERFDAPPTGVSDTFDSGIGLQQR